MPSFDACFTEVWHWTVHWNLSFTVIEKLKLKSWSALYVTAIFVGQQFAPSITLKLLLFPWFTPSPAVFSWTCICWACYDVFNTWAWLGLAVLLTLQYWLTTFQHFQWYLLLFNYVFILQLFNNFVFHFNNNLSTLLDIIWILFDNKIRWCPELTPYVDTEIRFKSPVFKLSN